MSYDDRLSCIHCGDDHTSEDCPLPVQHPALVMIPACMGGACAQRDHCGRHLTGYRANVVERLCQSGDEQPEPIDLAAWVSSAMLAYQQPGAS